MASLRMQCLNLELRQPGWAKHDRVRQPIIGQRRSRARRGGARSQELPRFDNASAYGNKCFAS